MTRPRPSLDDLKKLENELNQLKPKERAAKIKEMESDDVIQYLLREFGGKEI